MKLLILSIFILYYQQCTCVLTEAQIKSAAKLIRNVCQPKLKVTNEQISAIHKGEFDVGADLKCYMECVLKMAKIQKDTKMDFDSFMQQANTLPEERRVPTVKSGEACRNAIKSTDKCEAGYELYTCMYNYSPKDFFLP